MPIPVRCMNCGNVLADIWRYYERRTKELRGGQAASLLILDETKLQKTPEGDVLNELGLHRYCCRKELLTYRETYQRGNGVVHSINFGFIRLLHTTGICHAKDVTIHAWCSVHHIVCTWGLATLHDVSI